MLLFAFIAQPLVLYIQAKFRPLLKLWMADDGNVVAPIYVARKIYEYIKSEGPPQGLHMKVTTTKVWWPTMSSDLLHEFDCNVLCNRDETATEEITLLGAAFGSPSHIRSHFSKFASNTESILLSLKDIDDPQTAFQLQRYCHTLFAALRLGVYKHLCPPWTQLPAGALQTYTASLWRCCSHRSSPGPKPLFQFDTEALG